MNDRNGALRRWSTDFAAPRDRLDYWIGAICEGFLDMTASSPAAGRFEAELVSAALGPIGVNQVRSLEQTVVRSARQVARSRDNYFYLLCDTSVAWTMRQGNRSARLLPGDLVLIDSRRCYEFHFPGPSSSVSLQLPIAWVDAWLPEAPRVVSRRIDGSAGWGSVLGAYVRQCRPQLAVAPPLPAALLADQLGTLLSLATGSELGADSAPAGEPDLRKRALQALRERYAEPALTARAVSQGLGVSERSVHRCLSGQGMTFAQTLMHRRMSEARRMLNDRHFDSLSLAEIGRRVGLVDASHFGRACRAHWGATPRALRLAR